LRAPAAAVARPAAGSSPQTAGAIPAEAAGEAAPPKTIFTAKMIADLFSYPREITASDASLGPEWAQKGKVVWSIAFAAADDTFAPVTMILFDGRYRGMTVSDNQKDLLRRSGLFKDLAFGEGRAGYAMRAAGDAGDAEETASIPSPRGRYELLVLVDVPKDGPTEAPGTEAYRSLLTEFTVRLMETVAKGIDAEWKKGAR
jgi:hypothetical protein